MDLAATSAINSYRAARPGTRPDPLIGSPDAGSAARPGNTAGAVLRDFAETLKEAEATAQASMVSNADPHALVTALAQSELAVETAVTVRNKVVEAYQEILRMPV